MSRHGSDFRNHDPKVNPEELLEANVWYRSPLWNNDHLVGETRELYDEQLSWCGRPLGTARDWKNAEYGGLWRSQRKSGKCGPCETRQGEFEHAVEMQGENYGG